MAVRSRLLLPDIAVQTASGEMEVVSRQALLEAMADAVILQEMAGGFISLAVQRVPTGAPNEMVTVSAMVEWKDRTDAKAQPEARATPPQAEPAGEWHAGEYMPPFEVDPEEVKRAEARQEELKQLDVGDASVQAEIAARQAELADSPDGLDESTLEEEDVSAIPEHSR